MANDKNFTADDLKSGYVVELRNGTRYLVARAHQRNFTKILVDPRTGDWAYLSNWCHDSLICNAPATSVVGKAKNMSKDIMAVYGLVSSAANYGTALDPSDVTHRDQLWVRRAPVPMTLKQIEEKLGHKVLIVSEVISDEE